MTDEFRIADCGFTAHFPRAEPQRHRGTEKTQSRPTSQTRRHEDTKASQSCPSLTEKPQITQIDADSLRGFSTWRGPGRRTTAEDRCAGLPLRSQAIVAAARHSGLRSEDRRPRHFPSPFNDWEGYTSFPNRREERRNRRAPGAAASGKHGNDGRLRPEMPSFSPAVGDRSIAGCSAVNPRHCRITSARTSASICVICGFLARVGGLRVFVSSCLQRGRLCVSASLRLCVLFSVSELCVSVSLWFAGGRFLRTA